MTKEPKLQADEKGHSNAVAASDMLGRKKSLILASSERTEAAVIEVGIKSRFLGSLICRKLATCGRHQGYWKGRFGHPLRDYARHERVDRGYCSR